MGAARLGLVLRYRQAFTTRLQALNVLEGALPETTTSRAPTDAQYSGQVALSSSKRASK